METRMIALLSNAVSRMYSGLHSRHMACLPLLALILFGFIGETFAAGLTASLDRSTVSMGETATLSLIFDGGTPSSGIPQFSPPQGLQVQYVGQSAQFTVDNGRSNTKAIYSYRVTPTQPGEYVIPAIQGFIGSQAVASQPVKLTVTKSSPGATTADGAPKAAFLKLIVPKTNVYVGEIIPIELHLYVISGEGLQQPQVASDGFVLGTLGQPEMTTTQVNNVYYRLLNFKTTATPVKAGTLTLGPAQCSLVVHIPRGNSRSRDPNDFPDPFDVFGPRMQKEQRTLQSEPVTVEVNPLPTENKPNSFTGAVGNFSMAVNASPTNLTAGDPITLRIQIGGQGALDAIALPSHESWKDFKVYPPTSKVEPADNSGLTGLKTFEQVVVPQNAEIKQLPEVQFSYFDPEEQRYKTLRSRPIALSVAPNAASSQPTVVAKQVETNAASPQPPQDIVHIKPYFGSAPHWGPPLIRQPWFITLQAIPLLAWVSVVVWRKRQENLASDPRGRRRRQVADATRRGLNQLRHHAEQNKSDEFFATLFRILQEQLGERLDLPASAITEDVVDERLRRLGASDKLIDLVRDLFHRCNQARYAPVRTSQELVSLVPQVENALEGIKGLRTPQEA